MVSADSPLPPDIPSSYDNLEEIAKKEQCRLEELIRSKGMKYGSYPQFTVTVKGKKIAIKFPVPSYCDIPGLILNLALSLNGGSVMDVQIRAREIEDTVLLALRSPEVYDDIARGTRRKYESNRPRAVLFEGPPGTGKTSCARVIANQAGVPLLYVPLEVVVSKNYGESERLLGNVFSLANELPDGAIIFLDEVDSFAIARDGDIHEVTRRILSVLLRQIDGFEQDKKVVVIVATNRKQDIDPALISRFDSMIFFDLPDQQNRQKIAAQYTKHLTNSELDEFASVTKGLSDGISEMYVNRQNVAGHPRLFGTKKLTLKKDPFHLYKNISKVQYLGRKSFLRLKSKGTKNRVVTLISAIGHELMRL